MAGLNGPAHEPRYVENAAIIEESLIPHERGVDRDVTFRYIATSSLAVSPMA